MKLRALCQLFSALGLTSDGSSMHTGGGKWGHLQDAALHNEHYDADDGKGSGCV